MKWKKVGLLFGPEKNFEWMQSHATHPFTLRISESRYRVYFSCRDKNGYSNVAFVELDINNPQNILAISDSPILRPGDVGTFDEHGVFGGCLVAQRNKLYMYYLGWIASYRRPLFYSSIGLAISDDGGRSFCKLNEAPIIERSAYDPCGVLLPCVLKEDGVWRMWYGSLIRWEVDRATLRSVYNTKYATSQDGLHWDRNGIVCLDFEDGERNVAHPFVLKESDGYRMWFSYNRGDGYRSGYAESSDGIVWQRKGTGILELSKHGWDSQTIQHQHVINHGGTKFMFYNGNNFGQDGFGLAVEVEG